MPHRLLIRLLSDGSSEWLAQGRDGAVLHGPQRGLPSTGADQVVVVLPAEDVLLLDAPRIGKSRAQLAQALPFAIEEQLAAAVESQHVAFDEHAGGESVPVAVIARTRLDGMLARLRSAGLAADAAYAEPQLLPRSDGVVTVFAEPGRLLLRWARSGALAIAPDRLDDTLQLLRDAGIDARELHVIGTLPAPPADAVVVASEPHDHPLRVWATRIGRVDGPNLLQGDYRTPRRRAEASGLWRWAAGLAVLAVLLGFAHAAIERARWQAIVAARQAEMEQLLRHAVPGVQRVVDPVAQLRIELERVGGQQAHGALPLLAQVAPAIAGSGRYTLESLEFRAGTLELVIVAPDVAALDQLREGLAAMPPLQVELTAATPGSRGVEGRLRIRGGAA